MNHDKIMYAMRCVAGNKGISCENCAYKCAYLLECQQQAGKDIINLVDEQQSKIEALKREIDVLKEELADARYLNTVAANDAVKEFAQKLNAILSTIGDSREWLVIADFVNQLVREITEE